MLFSDLFGPTLTVGGLHYALKAARCHLQCPHKQIFYALFTISDSILLISPSLLLSLHSIENVSITRLKPSLSLPLPDNVVLHLHIIKKSILKGEKYFTIEDNINDVIMKNIWKEKQRNCHYYITVR